MTRAVSAVQPNESGAEEEDSTTEDTETSERLPVESYASCVGIGLQWWRPEAGCVSVSSVISVVDSGFFKGKDGERL